MCPARLRCIALQTLQTVAFLSSFSMLKPEVRFLVLVPKVGDVQVVISVFDGSGPQRTGAFLFAIR